MKNKLLLILLIVCGCGGGAQLTKSFCDQEQGRVDAYYDFRARGASFGQMFYVYCDSVNATLSSDQQKLLAVYTSIRSIRQRDSLDMWSSAFYKHAKDLLDANFAIARGTAK